MIATRSGPPPGTFEGARSDGLTGDALTSGEIVNKEERNFASLRRGPRSFGRRNLSLFKAVPEEDHTTKVPLSPTATGTGGLSPSSRSLLPKGPSPPSLPNSRSITTPEPSPFLETALEPFGAGSATNARTKNSPPVLTFEDLLARCAAMLGVPAGAETQGSLRRVLKAWSEGSTTLECGKCSRMREASRPRRSRQRPSLPVEARGRTIAGVPLKEAFATGQNVVGGGPPMLSVRGSQVDSSANKDRQLAKAEAAAARWEKRYNQQVLATEKAQLEKRNASIALREVERLLEEERTAATKAVEEANNAAAEAVEALREVREAQADGGGALQRTLSESVEQSLQSTVVRERCETRLRQRLQAHEAKLLTANEEIGRLREALKAAEMNRSLQPVVVALGEILKESLASLGMVRGVPEVEFHAMVSVLRDRAEKAAQGFLSVEGLHAAAEGARALDTMSSVRAQLHEALLDASRQRARRVAADAQLKERETGEIDRTFGKEDLIKARKETEDTRSRLAVANAEATQLKKSLREEQERSAAAWRAVSLNRAAPIANVRNIFNEGHRMVQERMKLKAQQIQQEVSQMQSDLAGASAWC